MCEMFSRDAVTERNMMGVRDIGRDMKAVQRKVRKR